MGSDGSSSKSATGCRPPGQQVTQGAMIFALLLDFFCEDVWMFCLVCVCVYVIISPSEWRRQSAGTLDNARRRLAGLE